MWGDREFTDASHRVFATARSVRFREMEYALPAENVRPAFDALRALVDERGWRISFPVEVRFAAADDRWLSTAHGRASGYIAVHRYWREDPTEYFEAVEQIMLALRRASALGQDAHPGCRDPARAVPPVRRLRRAARPARPRAACSRTATSSACSVSNG